MSLFRCSSIATRCISSASSSSLRGVKAVGVAHRTLSSSTKMALTNPVHRLAAASPSSAIFPHTLPCFNLKSAVRSNFFPLFGARSFSSESSSAVSSESAPPSSSSSSSSSSVAPSVSYHSVVVSLFGPDRAGIVADMSEVMSSIHGNIEESRMTILGDDFAIIVLVSVPSDLQPQQIKQQLEQQFGSNFVVGARFTDRNSRHVGFSGPVRVLQLSAEGPDQPNVLNRLSHLLRKFNVSIRDLDTDTASAPFAGYKNFLVKTIIAVPTKVDLDSFSSELQTLGDDLGFDISLADPQREDEEEEQQQQQDEEEEEEEEGQHARGGSNEEEGETGQDDVSEAMWKEAEERASRIVAKKLGGGGSPSSSQIKPTSQLTPSERSARLAEMEAAMRAAAAKRAATAKKPLPSSVRR